MNINYFHCKSHYINISYIITQKNLFVNRIFVQNVNIDFIISLNAVNMHKKGGYEKTAASACIKTLFESVEEGCVALPF